MSAVVLKQLGSIDLVDLEVINQFFGRDFLPHPFQRTQPTRFADRDEYRAYARSVPDRYRHGDLQVLRKWFSSYVDADIRVECDVLRIPMGSPGGAQIVAHRSGESGYLATQRPDEDVLDVFTLSLYDLGAAIADTVPLTKPGKHSEIAIPEFGTPAGDDLGAEAFTIQHNVVTTSVVAVPRADIAVFSTIQSHWQPARKWGINRDKNLLVWGRIKDDGDYISIPGSVNRGKPMTRQDLSARIDRLIAEDVVKVREKRGL